ncbi:MAG: hypothetical protein WC471_05325 [Candidatus Woesearchaeota archaeon]
MNKKIIAILMCMLIIMMPICAAAQMGSIKELKVYGSDVTDGYRRSSGDNTIIDALVSIDSDSDITASQVLVQGLPFDQCSDEGSNNFRCIYTEKESISYNPQAFAFKVDLFDDSGALSATKTGSLVIDVNKPEITSLSVEKAGKIVKLSYSVKDTACNDASCANKCAGLKTLDISGYKIVSINSSKCAYSGVENLELESGTYQLSVTAYDGVGNSVTRSTEPFSVDSNTASETMEKVTFVKNGKEYFYIGTNGQKGSDVVVYLEESDIDSVTGDLSSLNKVSTYKSRYTALKATCEDLGGIARCVWKDIYVWPDSLAGAIELDIKDKSANTGEASASYSLKSDDGAPTVTSIGTKCDGTRCYLREKNNTIIVKINEAGSGFNRTIRIGGKSYHNVGLNLGEVSSLYNIKKSEKCENAGGIWNCYFYNIVADKGHGQELKVFVATDSMDDAGNVLSGKLEETFMVDIREPVKKSIEIKSDDKPGYALEGQGLSVSLIVNDDTAVSAVGHFGGVIMDANAKPTQCSLIGDKEYECVWTNIGVIAPGPQTEVSYSIEITDMAGNTAVLNESIDIVEAEGLPKKYWMLDGAIVNSPSAISKDTLFREQKVFFSVPLKSAVRDIKVVDAVLTNCSSRAGLNIVKNAIVTPKNSIFISAISANVPEGTASLHASCTLRIVSVVNRVRLAQPQDLVIEMSVPLVSASLGTISERVADKINKAKERAKSGIGGILDTLDKVFSMLEMICKLLQSFNTINSVFQHMRTGLSAPQADIAAAATLGAAEPVRAAEKAAGATVDNANRAFSLSNSIFCKLISCENGPLGNLWGDGLKESMTGLKQDTASIAARSKQVNAYNPKDLDVKFGGVEIPDTAMFPNDPKNNLILSIMWGCIPGIIMNLKKMKDVQCMYIDCLQNEVPKGTPMRYCDEQLGYQQCRFVYGQIFGALPFGNALKNIGEFFKKIFNDPISMVFGVGSILCTPPKPGEPATTDAFCRVILGDGMLAKMTAIMSAYTNVKGVMDQFKGANGACEKVGL